MRRTAWVAAAGLAAVVLLGGFAVQAHGHWGRHGPERLRQLVSWRVDDTLDDLEATRAQRQAIHGIKDRLLGSGQRLMEAQKGTHAQVLAQLESPTPDARALHALVDARMDAMRAFAHEAADAALQAHGVLEPAQRQALAKQLRERHGRH
ncbi:MAG TPA: Spy/CpxP family protein refolding chaperone [Aggregicoccus sp.]|nr:Spy/CpxP family protein refolding chaperone [Aggregicoccus sp.]